MAQLSRCPHCGQDVRIPETLAGMLVKCPSCSSNFTAEPPSSSAAPLPPMARSERDRDREPSPYEDDWEQDEFERPRRPRRPRRDGGAPDRGGTVLTLGILSLVFSLFCPLVGIILGASAWSMGNTDLGQMSRGHMDDRGQGSTRGGMVCGIIGTILSILGMCLGVMLRAAGRLNF